MKGAENLVSDAQKKAARKWDSEILTNICIRVRKEYAQRVHEICRQNGTTASAIMREAIDTYMQTHDGGGIAEGESEQ